MTSVRVEFRLQGVPNKMTLRTWLNLRQHFLVFFFSFSMLYCVWSLVWQINHPLNVFFTFYLCNSNRTFFPVSHDFDSFDDFFCHLKMPRNVASHNPSKQIRKIHLSCQIRNVISVGTSCRPSISSLCTLRKNFICAAFWKRVRSFKEWKSQKYMLHGHVTSNQISWKDEMLIQSMIFSANNGYETGFFTALFRLNLSH